MPLEIGITLAAFGFYMVRTRGLVGPPIVLLVALLGLQAINWLAPHPAAAGAALYVQALIAFALLTALA